MNRTGNEQPETGNETRAKIFSVSDLTRKLRRIIEGSVGCVWVEGEISNFKPYASGHSYFTLKDEGAQIRCMVWAEHAERLNALIADGRKIRAFGRVSVYEKGGQYQLYVEDVREAGRGALQEAFEKLKSKLKAEGLFDASRKRPLPPFPRSIGVVTSPQGAAIRDFLRTLDRRFAGLHILIHPSRVQGEGAAGEIARAIRALNEWGGLDLIVVMRGGGSLEDLWAFNEEEVARALAASRIPTVSAVGHEVDFTISDFVADFRAATPTAAAEQLIRSRDEWLGDIGFLRTQLVQRTRIVLAGRRERLDGLRRTLVSLDPRQALREGRERLENVRQRMRELDPRLLLGRWNERLARYGGRLAQSGGNAVLGFRHRFEASRGRLELLNPRATLNRGYSLTTDPDTGKILRSVSEAAPGVRLRTELADGRIDSVVEKTAPSGPSGPVR